MSELIFNRISYEEIPIILADNSEADRMKELKSILSPVYNSGIMFENVYYAKLDDSDEFANLEDKSYIFKYIKNQGESLSSENPENLIIVYSSSFDNTSENLYQRAHDLNWNMIADESTDIESGLIFMYVFTAKQNTIYKAIEKNLIEIAHAEGLISEEEYTKDMTDEEKVAYLTETGNTIMYYVTYGIMNDKGIKSLEHIVISHKEYITSIDDIATVISFLSDRNGVKPEEIFLLGFSLMGNPVTSEEAYNDIMTDLDEEAIMQDSMINSELNFYCNRITYRLNGEERIYDAWQNIDLCADDNTTEHLAKSLIAEEEGLTEEDLANIEIINVELISSGSFEDFSDQDDEDEED